MRNHTLGADLASAIARVMFSDAGPQAKHVATGLLVLCSDDNGALSADTVVTAAQLAQVTGYSSDTIKTYRDEALAVASLSSEYVAGVGYRYSPVNNPSVYSPPPGNNPPPSTGGVNVGTDDATCAPDVLAVSSPPTEEKETARSGSDAREDEATTTDSPSGHEDQEGEVDTPENMARLTGHLLEEMAPWRLDIPRAERLSRRLLVKARRMAWDYEQVEVWVERKADNLRGRRRIPNQGLAIDAMYDDMCEPEPRTPGVVPGQHRSEAHQRVEEETGQRVAAKAEWMKNNKAEIEARRLAKLRELRGQSNG